jgi:hypothetical protein
VRVKMNPTASLGLACATTLNHALLGTTFDRVSIAARSMGPAEGLGLVDGSLVAGRVKRLDAQGLKYTDAAGVERSLAAKAVACIFTCPLPPDIGQALAQHKEGLSLATGDEIEGSVEGVRDGKVTVASLLFGRQTEPLSKVVMAVLQPMKTGGGLSVCTRDGSIYRCIGVTTEEGMLIAEAGVAGTVSVKAEDLAGINLQPAPQ